MAVQKLSALHIKC